MTTTNNRRFSKQQKSLKQRRHQPNPNLRHVSNAADANANNATDAIANNATSVSVLIAGSDANVINPPSPIS